MAKKKPAVKMPVKKPVVKPTGKKPVAKAPLKKAPVMTKKTSPKKPLPVVKKTPPKKGEKVTPPKSLKETVLEAAKKILPKAKPVVSKVSSKAPLKPLAKEVPKKIVSKQKAVVKKEALKSKEKTSKETKEVKGKEKELKAKEKPPQKKQKVQEKIKVKPAKDLGVKPKSKKYLEEDEDEDFEGISDEDLTYEEVPQKRASEEDDFDEFEEEYKKSKATKKTGKKAYEEDADLDVFPSKQLKKTTGTINDLQTSIAEEIALLREHFNWKEIAEAIGSLDFFINPKNDECIEKGCDNLRTTQSYCRLHYLRNWKTIEKKREILKEGKLQEYIEELISKYPPKYIEALLSDLSDDKEFYRVLNELNITSEFEFEEDEFENAVDDDDTDDDIPIESISSALRYEDE